jgi:hypothetical protein
MHKLRKTFLRCTAPIHETLRGKKVDIFMDLLNGDLSGSLLDVGGDAGITGEFLRLYSAFKNVTVTNISMPPHLKAPKMSSGPDIVIGDGCSLPLGNKSYDWVFSNAVIEHVGGWERQKLFANEIRRVARKGYFITTPNRYFPIEPHTYLPFYHFLPPAVQRKMIHLAPAWVHDYASSQEIDLLSPKQVRELFPEAQIIKVGFPMVPNSLIACYCAG